MTALPDAVRAELDRVSRRWQELPLDAVAVAVPGVRSLAQSLADAVADGRGCERATLPDLGPATLLHQLQVCVYDAVAGDATHGAGPVGLADGLRADAVAERLAALRRSLP